MIMLIDPAHENPRISPRNYMAYKIIIAEAKARCSLTKQRRRTNSKMDRPTNHEKDARKSLDDIAFRDWLLLPAENLVKSICAR